MANDPIEKLRERLQDPEFAKLYGADQARVKLALTLFTARSKLRLSQRQLAQMIGASQPYVAKLERGDANPTIARIGTMLAPLGLRLVTSTEPLLPPRVAIASGETAPDAASTHVPSIPIAEISRPGVPSSLGAQRGSPDSASASISIQDAIYTTA